MNLTLLILLSLFDGVNHCLTEFLRTDTVEPGRMDAGESGTWVTRVNFAEAIRGTTMTQVLQERGQTGRSSQMPKRRSEKPAAESPEVAPAQPTEKPKGATSGGDQVAFRAYGGMKGDLERIAAALGLDVSNLVRMIIRENLYIYERRVEQIEKQRRGDD